MRHGERLGDLLDDLVVVRGDQAPVALAHRTVDNVAKDDGLAAASR
jgi:hypothetical protein